MKQKIIVIFFSFCFLHAKQTPAQNNYVDSLRKLLPSAGKPIARFDILHKIAEAQFRGANVMLDSSFCLELLRIAQNEKNDSLLAISYNWLGNYFSWTSDFKSALEYFLKGVPLAKKVNDKRRLCSFYIDISFIHNSLKNFIEEFNYIKLAEASLPGTSSPMYSFMNIQVKSLYAKYYYEQNRPDSALKYTQASNEVNVSLKSIFFAGMINALFGGVYEKLGDKELAEIYFKKGVAILDSNPQFQAIKFQRMNYVSFLTGNEKLNEAKRQAQLALKHARLVNNNELSLAAAASLQTIYDKEKNNDSAYYYLQLQSVIRDSVFSREKINRIQSLAFAEQLRMREEELKNQQLQAQRKQEIQFMMIGIGIIILSIVFLLLSHSIVANEAVIRFIGIIGLLVLFEFINLVLHPLLGNLTHHSPLLMLLIMVCIAALLVPLHHKLEKWITHRMVEKNKRIRLQAARRTIEKLEKKND